MRRNDTYLTLEQSSQIRTLASEGKGLEEVAELYPETSLETLRRVMTRVPLDQFQREEIWRRLLNGEAEEDVAKRVGATRGQLNWVRAFFLPVRYYPAVAVLLNQKFHPEQIYNELAGKNIALSQTAVDHAIAVIQGRWAKPRQPRGAFRKIPSRGLRAALRARANSEAVGLPTEKDIDTKTHPALRAAAVGRTISLPSFPCSDWLER